MNTNQNYECNCGWRGHEDELRTECTFNETRLEPAEYEAYCPDCGANWDQMSEAEADMECPGCGEIALAEGDKVQTVDTHDQPYTFTEYTCRECGHYQTM